jgi:hypothetical protein
VLVSGSPTTATGQAPAVFRIATAPARWLSRVRPELRATLDVDAERARGSGVLLITVLAAIAVGYPVLASVWHAVGEPTFSTDWLGLALRPVYDSVYTESLPFMLAVAGIGVFSPALGVLLLAVFIPADLIATRCSGSWQSRFPSAAGCGQRHGPAAAGMRRRRSA